MRRYESPTLRTQRIADRIAIVLFVALLVVVWRVVTPAEDDAGAAPVAWVAPEQAAVTP